MYIYNMYEYVLIYAYVDQVLLRDKEVIILPYTY